MLGAIVIGDNRVAVVTVSVAVFVTDPSAAVIVVVPPPTAVASPMVGAVMLMVATELFDDVHSTDAVISWVVPSLKFPVALNCSVVPSAIVVVADDMVMKLSVAGVTVSVVDPEMPPNHAVMVVVPPPGATGVAIPLNPAALLIVATPASAEVQVTSAVMSSTEPSSYVPLAENCTGSANETLGSVGVTWIDTSVVAFTVRSVLPDTPANVTVMVVNPAPTELASPLEPGALSTVATVVDEELQTADAVRSSVV